MSDSKQALNNCYFCPNLCRYSCPVADVDQTETSTPQAKMTTMKLLAAKRIPWNKEAALQAYNCSDCGIATEACELDNPVARVLDQFRVLAFKKGMSPDSIYQYCKKFKRRNNPYNIRLLEKLKKGLPQERFKPSGVTYFPGCSQIYRDFDVIRQTLELFDKLEIGTSGVFDQPIQCCAYPLLAAGDLQGFKDHAEVMMHMLEDYPLLVTGSPACLFTLKHLYPAYGFPLRSRFLSLTDFLDPYVRQKNFHIRKGIATRVAYHDPCYAGRYLHEYDQPRRMLQTVTGEVPLEFRRCRENSYCSGGGGLLPVTRPETARKMTENRLDEFKETGANVLVTSCSTCEHRFKKYGQRVAVKNIVEFLNSAIKKEGANVKPKVSFGAKRIRRVAENLRSKKDG